MDSSAVVDSGKFTGGRSNFSKTCILLSQYLKERGSFGDLTLGLTQNFESQGAVAAGKVNLLPAVEESGETNLNAGFEDALQKLDLSAKSETQTAQMTIFYDGEVMVFDDFPADKVKQIMASATRTSAIQNHHSAYAPRFTAQSPAESATNNPNMPCLGMQDLIHHTPPQPFCSDLPLARKNSLARFLQKRKDRIRERTPYQTIKPAATGTPAEGEAWLGLSPQSQVSQI